MSNSTSGKNSLILTTFQVSCAWFIYGASGGSSLFRGFLSHSFCHLVFMYLCMIGLKSEGGVRNGCMLLLMINGNDQNCIHMGIYVQLSCKSSTDAVLDGNSRILRVKNIYKRYVIADKIALGESVFMDPKLTEFTVYHSHNHSSRF